LNILRVKNRCTDNRAYRQLRAVTLLLAQTIAREDNSAEGSSSRLNCSRVN